MIINVLKSIPKKGGGPSGYVWNLLKGIEMLDLNTVSAVFYLQKKNNSSNNVLHGRYSGRYLEHIYYSSPISALLLDEIRTIKILKEVKLISKWFIDSFIPFVKKKYRDMDNLYIHIHQSIMGFAAKEIELRERLKRITKKEVKIIYTSHSGAPPELEVYDLYFDLFGEKVAKMLLQPKVIRKMTIDSIKYADVFLAPSPESIEEYYRDAEYQNVLSDIVKVYVETGVFFKNNIVSQKSERRYCCGYLGRFHPHRGIRELIRLLSVDRKHTYVIGGSGPPQYENKIKKISMHKNKGSVLFLGWTDPKNVLCASEISIFPNRYSLFDIAMLESLVYGQKIIATCVGGFKRISRIFPKSVYCVKSWNNISWVVSQIDKLLNERVSRKKISKKAIKKYNAMEFAKRYVNTISKI